MNELKEISDKEEQMSRLKDILELTQEDYDERSKIAQYIQVKLHTIQKVKFLSKNLILTKPQQFHEFFTQIFFDNFSREFKVVNS